MMTMVISYYAHYVWWRSTPVTTCTTWSCLGPREGKGSWDSLSHCSPAARIGTNWSDIWFSGLCAIKNFMMCFSSMPVLSCYCDEMTLDELSAICYCPTSWYIIDYHRPLSPFPSFPWLYLPSIPGDALQLTAKIFTILSSIQRSRERVCVLGQLAHTCVQALEQGDLAPWAIQSRLREHGVHG